MDSPESVERDLIPGTDVLRNLVGARTTQDLPAGSHLWDASTSATLDAITGKYRRHGKGVEIIGMKGASAWQVNSAAKFPGASALPDNLPSQRGDDSRDGRLGLNKDGSGL